MSLSRNVAERMRRISTDIARRISTVHQSPPDSFSVSVKALHWIIGAGVLGCFGAVQAAMYTTKKYQPIPGWKKSDLMDLHKSLGLLVGACVLPRIAVRMASEGPVKMASMPHGLGIAADASHLLMYFLMVAMPLSGASLGYFSGKGIPYTTFLHVGATGWHWLKGEPILRRIVPGMKLALDARLWDVAL
ncbi:hypothetical protein M885DRAFT_564602 [Pelagophyceae sp. CCMP2097]|nr:hypothetical protein M885DRAFT_564602 [Pelagophyceae sp. CCMP2097]